MRVLALAFDGADYALVRRFMAEGRLPTISRLAREGAFGPLRSTIPAFTPTAWSSFLTGLNPGRHGIFNFTTNPNRGTQRLESAASRAGTPIWRLLGAAGIRSAYVGVPFTYPAEPLEGIVVTGYGGPERPQILPASAEERIFAAYPDLVTAHHPMAERWWENFPAYTERLLEHADEVAGVCKLIFELEPELGLLCVDFMSTDHIGHLGYSRFDPEHPAHEPNQTGDEILRVYERVDAACGELIEAAAERYGEEPTVLIFSDHGMKPLYWMFHLDRWLEEHGHLRFRRRSLQPWRHGRLDYLARVDQKLVRTLSWYGRVLDAIPFLPRPAEDRAFADIDFGSTRAYAFASSGQLYLGELTGARDDPAYVEALVAELSEIPHPQTGEPAFQVLRKEELYSGPFLDKAPELVLLPYDERINVNPSRRRWEHAFELHERLDPEISYGYSGHHGVNGILAAAGPGIEPAEMPEGSEIVQLPATILRLLGLSAEGLDGEPLAAILEEETGTAAETVAAETPREASDEPVYSEEEERQMVERLRDLGYE
ncbi:MAG: alkaline phosphatase family protein [Gaiellaceae bacterium]